MAWLGRLDGLDLGLRSSYDDDGNRILLRAIEELAAWLMAPPSGGIAMVAGRRGAGKSTVLGLVAVLSSPVSRELFLRGAETGSIAMRAAELLPHGKDLIAVDAKDLSTDLVALGLARGFSSARSASELLKEVEGIRIGPMSCCWSVRSKKSTAPEELVRDLLVPLSRHLGLPLIAGALRSLLPSASSSDLVIDLDSRGEPVAGPAVSVLAFGNDVDGTPLLASAGADRIRLWHPDPLREVGDPMAMGGVTALAFGRDSTGRALLVAAGDRGEGGRIQLWDVTSRIALGAPSLGSSVQASTIALGADQRGNPVLALGAASGAIRLLNTLDGSGRVLIGHVDPVTAWPSSWTGPSSMFSRRPAGRNDSTLEHRERATDRRSLRDCQAHQDLGGPVRSGRRSSRRAEAMVGCGSGMLTPASRSHSWIRSRPLRL